ncbi:MAG: DNA methyltransferase [Vicinamibacterales bacterium]
MNKDTRSAIEGATQRSRKLLEEDFSAQLEGTFDVLRSGTVAAKGGAHLSARQGFQRDKIVAAIEHKRAAGMTAAEAVTDYVRDAAFTTLNRFVALKMLEARELVQECISKGDQSVGYREFCGMAPGVALLPDAAGYRLYIESLFDELSTEVKVLFDRRDAGSALWPKRQPFEALLAMLNAADLDGVWSEDETIGWVYQFFNSGDERRKMREESQAPRNSRELAVRNQFFTPRYVVQFLTDNTLGRTWLQMRGGETALADRSAYLVRDEEALAPRAKKDPRDLKVLDPACGSGHFLLYAFELLLTIYEEAWHDQKGGVPSQVSGRSLREDYADLAALRRAVPALIVEHNLYGVDIDPRCAQIAALALWLRAQRAFNDFGLTGKERTPITGTHIVVAEPMPGEVAMVDDFAASLEPPLLRDLFKKMVGEMRLAGDLGTLLRVEDGIATELTRAREQFIKQRATTSFLPDMEPLRRQGELDLSGIDDAQFFHEAETRIVEALRHFAESAAGRASVRRRLFAGDAAQGIALIDLLRTRFDVVLMNPPFGAGSVGAKKEFAMSYPRTKNDVYAAFVERGIQLLHKRGMLGAITSRSGFFLSSFQKWREEILLKEAPPVVVADLGYGVLDSAMVEVAAYCLERAA